MKTLSYLNLIFAVLYFLEYLQNGNPFAIAGVLAVVIFNWMELRGLEREQLKWPVFQWVTAALTLCFALYTGYSAVILLLDAIEYHYYPLASILLISSGLGFTLAILLHLYLGLKKSIIKKTH